MISTVSDFEGFKKACTAKQFSDIKYLTESVAFYQQAGNPELAKRIQVRINNVKKANQQKKAKQQQNVEKVYQDWLNGFSTEEQNQPDLLEQGLDQLKQQSPPAAELASKKIAALRLLPQVQTKSQQASSKQTNTPNAKPSEPKGQAASAKAGSPFDKLPKPLRSYFVLLVLIPSLLFALYQLFWATERYESEAQVLVKEPDSTTTMDATMAALSGLGVTNTAGTDPQILESYIFSNDMINYLDETIDLRQHFSDTNIDVFSRVHDDDSRETFAKYYEDHVKVEIDEASGILRIFAQGFDPDYAQTLAQTIVKRSEWYINSISHQLAEAQLAFIRKESVEVEDKLSQAQSTLLNFQQKYNLLDPTAEGTAKQQITYGLEGQISAKEAELKSYQSIMTDSAPRVVALQNELNALREQLLKERNKLAQDGDKTIPVSEIMAQFTDLKVKNELALQAYTSAQVSLEKARIETYRQIKYLVVVEAPTLPDSHRYPDVVYNITLFTLLAAMLYGIGRIILATIRELK
ncbi:MULTISPECIES: lipopolysaccharide biosynthesis protein [unclassified Vibrio]|uniref:Lipopolysaccharide biosynthesis protein n=1 Tax=Vibrio sp. HB236076 TaxID=3232307 RepID=A0AB39HGX0_9VIBR|nr:lipopolysaccharide biosynthesis protein [Vibrio sp. HB161653]MDP5254356.1 lipopolysaccharide biosynthesis protein [Vibrio sp. HB161653]